MGALAAKVFFVLEGSFTEPGLGGRNVAEPEGFVFSLFGFPTMVMTLGVDFVSGELGAGCDFNSEENSF
ncbi:MAG: hypothetical protein Tsb009_09430 [Planctomycetaceae bacterium]